MKEKVGKKLKRGRRVDTTACGFARRDCGAAQTRGRHEESGQAAVSLSSWIRQLSVSTLPPDDTICGQETGFLFMLFLLSLNNQGWMA